VKDLPASDAPEQSRKKAALQTAPRPRPGKDIEVVQARIGSREPSIIPSPETILNTSSSQSTPNDEGSIADTLVLDNMSSDEGLACPQDDLDSIGEYLGASISVDDLLWDVTDNIDGKQTSGSKNSEATAVPSAPHATELEKNNAMGSDPASATLAPATTSSIVGDPAQQPTALVTKASGILNGSEIVDTASQEILMVPPASDQVDVPTQQKSGETCAQVTTAPKRKRGDTHSPAAFDPKRKKMPIAGNSSILWPHGYCLAMCV
jgi:hypothetical protein